MGYDTKGRWVPDGEAINWKQDRESLRHDLTARGLDWRHEGKYAFRTDAWGQMSESQRLETLQAYDSWYDQGGQLALEDEAWGLDIERGITYNNTWDAQTAFHQMTGGNIVRYTIGKDLRLKKEYEKDGKIITEYGRKGEGGVQVGGGSEESTGWDWASLTDPYKYKDKVRGTLIGEVRDSDGKHISTTYQVREFPMDWKNYTNDELYRATIDELLEKDYMMFMGEGADFDNATQVRAASKEIQSWVNEAYDKARELGKDGAWAEAEWQKERALQIARGRIHNVRYPEGRNTRGFQHNQQKTIRKYQPWNKFDSETGTRTKLNPLTGEVRDTFKHKQAPEPTRMTIVGNKLDQNVDEGIFYSPTLGMEQEITDSMLAKPDDIPKPNLSIRNIREWDNATGDWINPRPSNIPANWKTKGDTKEVVLHGGKS